MSGRAPRSLQGRLLRLVVGTVAAVWLVAAAATWVDMRHEVDELLDSHLAQAAALLVAQQARDLAEHGDPRPDTPSLHRYAPKVAFQVWHEGQLAVRSANAPDTPMGPTSARPHQDRPHEPRKNDRKDHDKDDDDDEESLRSGFRTLTIDGTAWRVFATHGAERDVQVYVGEQVDSRAAILRALMRGMLWPMALALPLLAVAAGWGIHRGVAPLRRLGRILREREPRALAPVTLDDTPSEMAPALAALNDLFARIRTLMEAESRFTADAAHELRTPIAAIRTQAQVALAEADDTRRRHALRATLEGCDRAARLVEQLLTLSRLESQQAPADAVVDLRAVAERAVADAAPAALAKQQHIELIGEAPCLVQGHDTLLAVLLRNLVDNAVRYSPAGARIHVTVRPATATDPHVRLVVEDSGPGLSPADLARLGERFFRVLGTGESGSGLGWSIVRRIADVHRATVRVARSDALGGLAVDVAWGLLRK